MKCSKFSLYRTALILCFLPLLHILKSLSNHCRSPDQELRHHGWRPLKGFSTSSTWSSVDLFPFPFLLSQKYSSISSRAPALNGGRQIRLRLHRSEVNTIQVIYTHGWTINWYALRIKSVFLEQYAYCLNLWRSPLVLAHLVVLNSFSNSLPSNTSRSNVAGFPDSLLLRRWLDLSPPQKAKHFQSHCTSWHPINGIHFSLYTLHIFIEMFSVYLCSWFWFCLSLKVCSRFEYWLIIHLRHFFLRLIYIRY